MNIVVIGLGSMGKRRIRLLKSLKPESRVIGIDNNESRRKEASEIFQIVCLSDVGQVENGIEVDCAFVCTSPLSHADIINRCLGNNWNVFTEINLVEKRYHENIRLAKEKNLILFLSSTPMYRPEIRIIDNIIKKNNKMVNYVYHVGQYLPDWHPWESYYDFFVGDKKTNGCREIFAIELPWLINTFGGIQSIYGISNNLTGLKINYKDSYSVQLLHENGNIGTLLVDVVCRNAVRKLEVFNEELYLEWNGKPAGLRIMNLENKRMEQPCGTEFYNDDRYNDFINEAAYMKETEEFFEVLKGKEMHYTFEDDLQILKIINHIEG